MFYKTGVYCWTNIISKKVYVGGAYGSLQRRLKDYLAKFKLGKCHNRHLQYSWDKYGPAAFRFSILERCHVSILKERETHWIKELNATDPKCGYNICHIAGAPLGRKHSEEAKRKMSIAKKGIGMRTGAVLSEETKAKISASKKGKKLSITTRERMSANHCTTKMTTEEKTARARKMVLARWSKKP